MSTLDTSESPEQQLEKIFLQVEEESERRAEQERARIARQALIDESTLKRVKERRRGSISISRLGHYPVEESILKPPGSMPPTPGSFTFAANSPFYQSQIAAASTSSVASGASAFSDDGAHCEDPSSVIQIEQIPPKQSIATKIMPRRLSRARSSQILPKCETTAIIDVSVQETTESTTVSDEDEEYTAPSRRASVSARHSLRSHPSLSTVAEPESPSWIEKFTQKLKRKSVRKDSQSVPPTPMSPS